MGLKLALAGARLAAGRLLQLRLMAASWRLSEKLMWVDSRLVLEAKTKKPVRVMDGGLQVTKVAAAGGLTAVDVETAVIAGKFEALAAVGWAVRAAAAG